MEEKIIDEIKTWIDIAEKNYIILKDYLSGAEYNLDDIRGCLHSFKDSLSKIRYLCKTYWKARLGKSIDIPIDSLLEQIDTALFMLEFYSRERARVIIQFTLSLSHPKVEEIMALIGLIKILLSS